jgi:serine/threonine protein kinase
LIVGVIGRGGYGTVYKALDIESKELVALKRVQTFNPLDGLPVSFTRENSCLQAVCHPNIVSLKSVVSEGMSVFLVLEYCDFDLSALIRRHGLSFLQIQSYMGQLLSAVSALHELGFVHRDLKPANVFVTRANEVKLGDFGLARRLVAKELTQEVVTPCYRSPELLLGDTHYGAAVDVWSLGCVLYEMITGRLLFERLTSRESVVGQLGSIFKICGSPTVDDWPEFADLPEARFVQFVRQYPPALREVLDETLPPQFDCVKDLIQAMLQLNPAKRITVAAALLHPFFQFCAQLQLLRCPELHASDIHRGPDLKCPLPRRGAALMKPARVIPPPFAV